MLHGSGAYLADEWLDVAARGWGLRATQQSCDDRGRQRNIMGEEEAAQLLLGGHRSCWQVEQPHARDASEGHGKPVSHDPVIAPGLEGGLLIHQQES